MDYPWTCKGLDTTEQCSRSRSDFPGGSDGKESACNAGCPGSIPVSGRSLEKEMETHSSILTWETPWTQEPAGLQSMGSQRVGHDWGVFSSIPCYFQWQCGPRGILVSQWD